MAQFQPAIANTELNEGGYSFTPNDAGGETYRGISRRNWPNWSGWPIVDVAKSQAFFPTSLDSNAPLQAEVIQFYRTNYWRFDGINRQDVANKIFDLCVNVGMVHGIKIAQLAAGCNVDGRYGPQTEAAINNFNGDILPIIRMKAEEYHRAIVSTHPEDAVFLRGWIHRDEE